MKSFADKYINKFISKKLTVFVVGTIFLSIGNLESTEWMQLAIAYVGTQGFLDIVVAYKK